MKRTFTDYLWLFFKGVAMGAADIVPGISGGTIAFISGIYEELISSISQFRFSLLSDLKNKGLKTVWRAINGNFLVAIFFGIVSSFFILSGTVSWLIEKKPILIWGFFFGLVLASILFVFKKIRQLNTLTILTLILGVFVAYKITQLDMTHSSDSIAYMFFSGLIAICAMILPGISGAFILVIIGSYSNLIQAINEINLVKITSFSFGAIIGLLSFSKLLKWLFSKYNDLTLALLTGFMGGGLVKIWPWKKVLTSRTSSRGINVPLREECVLPFDFEGDPQISATIGLMFTGFLLIFIFDFISLKNKIH